MKTIIFLYSADMQLKKYLLSFLLLPIPTLSIWNRLTFQIEKLSEASAS